MADGAERQSSSASGALVNLSEGNALAAAPTGAALTRVQQTICNILDGGAQQAQHTATMPALTALASREARAPSCLDLKRVSSSCCFDTENMPHSWTAHRVCARCRELHDLMQNLSQVSSTYLGQAIVSAAMISTDCISASVNKSVSTPTLPVELEDMIMDIVFADWKRSKDGAAVSRLMHTSNSLRSRVIQNLDTARSVILYRRNNKHTPAGGDYYDSIDAIPHDDARVHEPKNLGARIKDTTQQYFKDMTTRRQIKDSEVREEADGQVVIMDTTGSKQVWACIAAWVIAEGFYYHKDDYHHKILETLASKSMDIPAGGRLTLADVMRIQREALEDLHLRRASDFHEPVPTPVFANAYQHVLSGEPSAFSGDMVIVIQLTISNQRRGGTPVYFKRSWLFDTLNKDGKA